MGLRVRKNSTRVAQDGRLHTKTPCFLSVLSGPAVGYLSLCDVPASIGAVTDDALEGDLGMADRAADDLLQKGRKGGFDVLQGLNNIWYHHDMSFHCSQNRLILILPLVASRRS